MGFRQFFSFSILVVAFTLLLSACAEPPEPEQLAPPLADKATPALLALPGHGPTLLLSQAQFVYDIQPNGKKIPRPGPAKLTSLAFDGKGFHVNTLEDAESRVFHKAICLNPKDSPRQILTLGATGAHLKTWMQKDNQWVGTSHWQPVFGGKWDRLRDVEIGDVNHDGADELVIATHDQGVIAVATSKEDTWQFEEVFRRANTFIHEIEIGDVNADGKLEFFATPSQPNKANRSQGGGVTAFFHTKKGTWREEKVVHFPSRHAKEILVTDLDGDGKDELYASVEAKTRKTVSGPTVVNPLEIRRYDRQKNGKWAESTVATLSGGIQARVMLSGDIMGKTVPQLVVTTMKGGIYALEPGATLPWTKHLVDADSSGFEHAAGLFDVDADGKLELYVAADDQDVIRRYQFTEGSFQGEVIAPLGARDLTWSIEFCP